MVSSASFAVYHRNGLPDPCLVEVIEPIAHTQFGFAIRVWARYLPLLVIPIQARAPERQMEPGSRLWLSGVRSVRGLDISVDIPVVWAFIHKHHPHQLKLQF